MKINWKVRTKNPVWWAQVVASIVLPMLAAVGMGWNEITTWAKLGEVIVAAVGNPVTVVAVGVSLWNTVTDPTTKGIGDSALAMTYLEPRADGTEEEGGIE